MKSLLVFLITVYKKAVSPVLPPSCRFYPGCADYARAAFESHGVLIGGGLAIKRLLRCQPFSEGGFDPVPQADKNAKETRHKHNQNIGV